MMKQKIKKKLQQTNGKIFAEGVVFGLVAPAVVVGLLIRHHVKKVHHK